MISADALWGYMAPTGFFLPGVPSFEGWGGGERREGSPMAPNRACVGQRNPVSWFEGGCPGC
jgi:hypothetical protein